jgi:hypothetical protein
MTRRTKAILAGAAAVAAIGAGSAALANASGSGGGSADKPDKAEPVQQQDRPSADVEKSDGERGPEVPGGDGPKGHADEPANPNANHETKGAE